MLKKALISVALTIPVCVQAQSVADTDKIDAAVTKLKDLIDETMLKTKVPGLAVAVVYKGEIKLLDGYGYRKLGDGAKVNPDTVFQIASLSKHIASTIVASLVGNGEVHWDDHIKTLDPSFELSDEYRTHVFHFSVLCVWTWTSFYSNIM